MWQLFGGNNYLAGFRELRCRTESFVWNNSFRSSSPFPSLSNLLNSAFMKFIHSCFDILPFLSVSSRSRSSLTFSFARANLSGGFGSTSVAAIAPVALSSAISRLLRVIEPSLSGVLPALTMRFLDSPLLSLWSCCLVPQNLPEILDRDFGILRRIRAVTQVTESHQPRQQPPGQRRTAELKDRPTLAAPRTKRRLLKFHRLTLHAAEEFASAAALCETLPLELCRGHALRLAHQRHLDLVSAGPRQGHRRSARRGNAAQAIALRRVFARHRRQQGNFSVPHPLDRDRYLARHGVRPAQRSVRSSGDSFLLLLPAPPHRGHHGPCHERLERGPVTARPRHHVLRQYHRLHRGRVGLHDLHQPLAHALHVPPVACGERRDPDLRPSDSRTLRTNSGHVLRHFRARAGEFLRRAPDSRLRAGRRRDWSLRSPKPGIHPSQPAPGAPHGHALAHPRAHAGLCRGARAVARRARSHPRTFAHNFGFKSRRFTSGNLDSGDHDYAVPLRLDERWPIRCLQHLHDAAHLADHRSGLGHQPVPAGHSFVDPHQRNHARTTRDSRCSGRARS